MGLVPLIVVPLVLVGASLWLCDHRDVGQGVLTDTGEGRTDTRPMTSPLALDLRLSRGRFLAWAAALGAYGVVLGYLAVDLADYFRRDKTMSSFTRKLAEGASMGSVGGLLGLMFGFLALVLAVYAGSQMVAGRTEEGGGRLDGLLASSVSRARWLWVRIGVGLASIVGLALVMGLATWLGVVATGASTSLGSVLAGALNVVPVALLFGGLSVLAFGLVPRLTAAVAFGAVAVAYLVQVVGAIAGAPGWLLDVSPFSHVAAVPAQSANVGAMAVMLALAAATTLAGNGLLPPA